MKTINVLKAGVFLVFIFGLANLTSTALRANSMRENPPTYFKLTLVAPTNNEARILLAQMVTRELWKIGIDAELVLVGWDALARRLFYNVHFGTFEQGGFDIGFVDMAAGSIFFPTEISQYYRSSQIYKCKCSGENWYSINNSRLDQLCSLIDSELDFEQRREWVLQALSIILWEEHPVMGLYQATNPFALDVRIRGFDAFRWSLPCIHVQELSYDYDYWPSEFIYATNARFNDLNPALSTSYHDNLIHQPTQSWTYQHDARMILKPVLATGDPIALSSYATVASTIDASTISADSPFAGAKTDALMTWGSNLNVDHSQWNPYKTANDSSMFLINLREDIPWHPGWGYDIGDLNVTVESFQWTLGYWLDDELGSQAAQKFKDTYGPNPEVAIQKINATMFKLNLRGPSGNGQIADWLDACAIRPLPQHILDPLFDARPFGGNIGVTPDGTTITAYGDHREYAYNTGEKPVMGVGPYYFENWNENSLTATLKKFDNWGGYNTSSLWHTRSYSSNNIDSYSVRVYPSKETAEIDLENDDIDGIDAQFLLNQDLKYLRGNPYIQVLMAEGNTIEAMGYNTRHPILCNRYVRLAISHIAPVRRFIDFVIDDFGSVNELVGIGLANPHKPNEEEFKLMGLDVSENVVTDSGETLEFQGHIRYNIEKAWALMEKAGYDMDPWRAPVGPPTITEHKEVYSKEPLPFFPLLLVILILGGFQITLIYQHFAAQRIRKEK
ncbi:MAG: ABC transporter substrate-binding protein [Candidatus Hodarchaeales archaeon]